MAAAADKARYFLERSIPELRELERKKIFSKDEISNIIKKRSDFEHKLNARGARSTDFARYVEFEVNLDSLRRKRAKRLGIKSGKQNSQRRIFQVLDRATKKFHGDLGLWMQYLGICRQQKSYNKINEVLSNVIRMHPTKPEVWIYAASYHMEDQGDMVEARSYMQRGLRFCRGSKDMWLTYARLELLYISKIHARQKILGLTGEAPDKVIVGDADEEDADVIALPMLTAEELNGTSRTAEEADKQLKALNVTPALSGAIPMAIFDAAMNHFLDAEIGCRFFDMTLDFRDLPCLSAILDHIVTSLKTNYDFLPSTLDCFIRRPIASISASSAEFPQGLAVTFSRLKEAIVDHSSPELLQRTVAWLLQALKDNVEEDIEQALLAILLRVLTTGHTSKQLQATDIVSLLKNLPLPSPRVISICSQVWPDDDLLNELADAKTGDETALMVYG